MMIGPVWPPAPGPPFRSQAKAKRRDAISRSESRSLFIVSSQAKIVLVVEQAAESFRYRTSVALDRRDEFTVSSESRVNNSFETVTDANSNCSATQARGALLACRSC